MALIESLDVVLSLSTAKFATGAKVAKGALSNLNAAVTSTKGLMVGLAGAAGIGLSLGAFKSFVSASFDAVDKLGDVADRLQITTEALGGLQYAAKLGGVEAETFEASLDRMVRTLGAIDSVSDPAAKSLARIGLDINQLRQLDTAEQFLQIADAINNVGSVAGRAAAATEIFGKRGTSLLVTFAGGRKGIEELAERFDALGGSFSRIDSAKVQLAADAMDDFKIAIGGVGNDLAIAFSPLITESVNRMTGDFLSLKDATQETGVEMSKLSQAAITIAGVGDTIAIGFKYAQVAVLQFTADAVGGIEMAGKHVKVFVSGILAEAKLLYARLNEWNAEAADNISDVLEVMSLGSIVNIDDGSKLRQRQAETVRALEEATKRAEVPELSVFSKTLQDIAAAARKEFDKAFTATTFAERLKSAYDALSDAANKKATEAAANAKRENELTSALEDQEKAAKNVADAFKNTMDAARELSERGMKIFDANRTPLEKFADEINNINFLLLEGAIDMETFNREAKRLQGELAGSTQSRMASAAVRDSDTARKIIFENQNRGRDVGPDIDKTLKQTLKENKEQNRTLKRIDENLRIDTPDLIFNIA